LLQLPVTLSEKYPGSHMHCSCTAAPGRARENGLQKNYLLAASAEICLRTELSLLVDDDRGGNEHLHRRQVANLHLLVHLLYRRELYGADISRDVESDAELDCYAIAQQPPQ